jgi:PAS domain S-box-containing protein
MNYKLEELIDAAGFQEMLDRLNETLVFPTAILDVDGKILTASGWRDICERFHRANPVSEEQCRLKGLSVCNHILDGDSSVQFRCPMGLIECATPIVIDGRYFGAVFMGQLFHEEPDIDAFRKQAIEYGFDEDDYLDALARVPVISRDRFERNLPFIRNLAKIVGEAGLKRLKQKESEQCFRTIFDSVGDAIFILDPETGDILDANAAMSTLYGYTREEARRVTLETISSGVAPYTSHEALARIRRAAMGEEQIFEWQARRKDGALFRVEVSMRKAFITPEETVLAVVRDITERECLRAELRKLAPFGDLIGEIAHDFNDLLSRILDNISLARTCLGDSDASNKYLRKAEDASRRVAEFSGRFLKLEKRWASVKETVPSKNGRGNPLP